MRQVIGALATLVTLAASAGAADLDFLRGSRGFLIGSPAYFRWEGFYFGGQVGYASAGANFENDTSAVIARLLSNTLLEDEFRPSTWPVIGKSDNAAAASYGAFVGYNGQWGDAVIGVDFSYNHSSLTVGAQGSMARNVTLSDDYNYDVTVAATGRITIDDYATLRVRGGYAMGALMPYVTAGVALGLASYDTTVSVSYPAPTYVGTQSPPPPNPGAASVSATEGKSNALIYGFAFGGGIDWALMPHVFLRGEYEFLQFSQMKANISNVRAGLGVKF